MGDHDGAVGDYTHAFQLGGLSIDDTLHFNRGNSYFALGKFQEALADFEACNSSAAADYNAGNTCIALGQLGDAKAKFEEAHNGPRSATQSQNNLEAVTRIVALIGTDQCEVDVPRIDGPNASRFLLIMIRSDRLTEAAGPRLFSIAGNTGNKGNFGWAKLAKWGSDGGQGFSGSDGITVVVTSSTIST